MKDVTFVTVIIPVAEYNMVIFERGALIMDINYDPEAFSDEWEERQAILRQMAQEAYEAKLAADVEKLGLLLDVAIAKLNAELAERGEDVDLFDLMREQEENDVPLDGDAESALASAGFGTDEDYGYYGYEDGGDIWND